MTVLMCFEVYCDVRDSSCAVNCGESFSDSGIVFYSSKYPLTATIARLSAPSDTTRVDWAEAQFESLSSQITAHPIEIIATASTQQLRNSFSDIGIRFDSSNSPLAATRARHSFCVATNFCNCFACTIRTFTMIL